MANEVAYFFKFLQREQRGHRGIYTLAVLAVLFVNIPPQRCVLSHRRISITPLTMSG